MVDRGIAASSENSKVRALPKVTFCLTIIWSSAGSIGPRLALEMAPVNVSSTGELALRALGAAFACDESAMPPHAAAARKLLLSMPSLPVKKADYGCARLRAAPQSTP